MIEGGVLTQMWRDHEAEQWRARLVVVLGWLPQDLIEHIVSHPSVLEVNIRSPGELCVTTVGPSSSDDARAFLNAQYELLEMAARKKMMQAVRFGSGASNPTNTTEAFAQRYPAVADWVWQPPPPPPTVMEKQRKQRSFRLKWW